VQPFGCSFDWPFIPEDSHAAGKNLITFSLTQDAVFIGITEFMSRFIVFLA